MASHGRHCCQTFCGTTGPHHTLLPVWTLLSSCSAGRWNQAAWDDITTQRRSYSTKRRFSKEKQMKDYAYQYANAEHATFKIGDQALEHQPKVSRLTVPFSTCPHPIIKTKGTQITRKNCTGSPKTHHTSSLSPIMHLSQREIGTRMMMMWGLHGRIQHQQRSQAKQHSQSDSNLRKSQGNNLA